MQRLIILSAFLSPFRSGAEAMVEEVGMRLQNQYDITIVTARLRRNLPRVDILSRSPLSRRVSGGEGEGPGVRVCRIGIGHPIDKYLFPFLAPLVARRLQPQMIHAVLESYAGLALVFCRWVVPKARRILTCQSTNTTFLIGLMHRSAHTVTVISTVLLERAQRFGKEAVVISNGIDTAAIQNACVLHPKISGRILFVGRLEQMKGVDILLQGYAQLITHHSPLTTLRIVGDGSQRSLLEKLAQELGIADRVTFVGWVKVPQVFDEFAQAEIFCGLSRSEALGNVFLEAQASGCAVIATNVGGIPDIVKDGETGMLIPPDDAEAAVKAFTELLQHNDRRKTLAKNGIAHAAAYDWEVITKKYDGMYQTLL